MTTSLSFLLSPEGIRARAQQIYQLACEGKTHFEIHEHKLTEVSEFVLQVIAENYPAKNVPYHSRWRHYEVGNQSQLKQLRTIEQSLTPIERAKMATWELLEPRTDTIPARRPSGTSANIEAVNSSPINMVFSGYERTSCTFCCNLANTRLPRSCTSLARSRR